MVCWLNSTADTLRGYYGISLTILIVSTLTVPTRRKSSITDSLYSAN